MGRPPHSVALALALTACSGSSPPAPAPCAHPATVLQWGRPIGRLCTTATPTGWRWSHQLGPVTAPTRTAELTLDPAPVRWSSTTAEGTFVHALEGRDRRVVLASPGPWWSDVPHQVDLFEPSPARWTVAEPIVDAQGLWLRTPEGTHLLPEPTAPLAVHHHPNGLTVAPGEPGGALQPPLAALPVEGSVPSPRRLRRLTAAWSTAPDQPFTVERPLPAELSPTPPVAPPPDAAEPLAPVLLHDLPATAAPLAAIQAALHLDGPRTVRASARAPDPLRDQHSTAADCDELAALAVARLQGAGWTARLVHGWLLDDTPPRLLPHAWAEIWIGPPWGWLAFDPALGQAVADAGHLPARLEPPPPHTRPPTLRVLSTR